MKINFSVKGKDRKTLATAIGEIVNQPVIYQGTPSFGYIVGSYSIDRQGTLEYDETDGAANKALLAALNDRGFISIIEGSSVEYYNDAPDSTVQEDETPNSQTPEAEVPDIQTPDSETPDSPAQEAETPDIQIQDAETPESNATISPTDEKEAPISLLQEAEALPIVWFGERPSPYRDGFYSDGPSEDDNEIYPKREADTDEDSGLTIEIPTDGFTDASLVNLEKMIASKAALIKKAIGTDTLTVTHVGDTLEFPWFQAGLPHEEVKAYANFISAMCKAAKEQKRVTATEKPVVNEKFAFRVFLIRLGFIGTEFAAARKILLRNLTGNSAFKDGAPPRKASTPEE